MLSSDDFAGHGRCFSSVRACKYPTEGSGEQCNCIAMQHRVVNLWIQRRQLSRRPNGPRKLKQKPQKMRKMRKMQNRSQQRRHVGPVSGMQIHVHFIPDPILAFLTWQESGNPMVNHSYAFACAIIIGCFARSHFLHTHTHMSLALVVHPCHWKTLHIKVAFHQWGLCQERKNRFPLTTFSGSCKRADKHS